MDCYHGGESRYKQVRGIAARQEGREKFFRREEERKKEEEKIRAALFQKLSSRRQTPPKYDPDQCQGYAR